MLHSHEHLAKLRERRDYIRDVLNFEYARKLGPTHAALPVNQSTLHVYNYKSKFMEDSGFDKELLSLTVQIEYLEHFLDVNQKET